MIMVQDQSFYKRLLLLAAPLALQNVVSYSVSLADNIMVGQLGELALSGAYVANQMQNILHMLVTGLSAALLVLGSQYWGKHETEKVRSVVAIALFFAFGAGLLLTILTLARPTDILSLFTDDDDVMMESMQYFTVIRLTYIFFCVTQVLVAAMRCVETVRIGLYLSILTFVTNVFLNWVLIFGHLGAPALGLRGAAIATLAARVIEATIMMIYVFFLDQKLVMRPKDFRHIEKELLTRFFRYGLPIILGDIFWGINLAVQGAIMGRLGQVALASVSIANVIFSILSVAVYGTAGATAIIIGQEVGSGDYSRLRLYTRTFQILFVIIGLISGLAVYCSRYLVPFIYDLEPETMQMVKAFLSVLSVMVVGTAYQMSCLTGIVRAGGSTHFVLMNDLIHIWGFVIPAASLAAFVFHASPVVVFALLKSDQLLKCIVAFITVNRYHWVKNLTVEQPELAAKV